MSRYAENTSVSVENSRAEIERTLTRYKAASFAYGWDQDKALIEFQLENRRIRFVLPLPPKDDTEFAHYKRGYTSVKRTDAESIKKWEQACRQRWRALALAVKAKLEVVESGISSIDDEFMAQIVLPNGKTVSQTIQPQIDEAYESGQVAQLSIGAAS